MSERPPTVPSPGGEGQGEGERKTNWIGMKIKH